MLTEDQIEDKCKLIANNAPFSIDWEDLHFDHREGVGKNNTNVVTISTEYSGHSVPTRNHESTRRVKFYDFEFSYHPNADLDEVHQMISNKFENFTLRLWEEEVKKKLHK